MSSASPFTIALAALLHDIGKFAQRAGWRRGRHTVVGGEFVRRYVPHRWREHLYPVEGHHDTPLEGYTTKVVALADRLSSGERAPQRQPQPQQMLSTFCRLELDPPGAKEADEPLRAPTDRFWPLKPLALDEAVLFSQEKMPPEKVAEAYRHLWQGFEAGAEALRAAHEEDGHLPTYLESLLLLMQRYTWCVPSAYYYTLPDVSLYDHSRTTAALAATLLGMEEARVDALLDGLRRWHQAQEAKPAAPPPPVLEEKPVALLVGGDLSGVQDFLYTITSQGAAGALRGRSFYLQLLTEAVVRFVLRTLALPITNLIYQGGGHFYLLARPGDEARLREAQEDLSRILLAHHRGDLYLALAWEPLAGADFYNGRIADAWGRLADGLRDAKQHRFAELGQALYTLFLPQDHGGNEEQQCQVCGREHPGTQPEDEVRKCPPCRSYEALGNDLRHARYLWLATTGEPQRPDAPLATPPGGWQEVLAALGVRAGLAQDLGEIAEEPTPRLLLALKDEAMEALRPTASTAIGRRFLVNVTPTIEEADARWFQTRSDPQRQMLMGALTTAEVEPPPQELPQRYRGWIKPFTWLEAQSKGIARLGVLRMDVDDLGEV
ncbi:MAG: type III-A CRISPR-associated protein Cas10/Csm1, partial [Chloroflexi bacterium]